jgi:peptidoglycan/LPS O-acetylase OafA/YrhL
MISDRVVDLMAGLSVLSIMMLTPYIRNVLFEMPLDGWLQNKFIPLSLIWGVFILAVADGRGVAGKIMKSTIFRKLGAWSFSIYLVHWMVYGVLATQYPNSIVWLVIAVLCSIAAGATMFMLVESNIEKIRHAIQYKLLRPRLVEN